MSDGEIIGSGPVKSASYASGGLGDMVASIAQTLNIKMAGILMLVLLFVNTTVYIEQVLSNVKGAVGPGNSVTDKGIGITSMMVCMAYLLFDCLITHGIV